MINKKYIIKIMKNYVEGDITTKDFWNFYLEHSDILKKILNKDKVIRNTDYSPNVVEKNFDITSLFDRFKLFDMCRVFLFRNKENFIIKNKDYEIMSLLREIQPSWLEILDENYLLQVLRTIPKEATKKEKIEIGRKEILSRFIYEKKPPIWVQSPEWPFNSKMEPLIFKEQINHSEYSEYIFIDHSTSKITTIEQYY